MAAIVFVHGIDNQRETPDLIEATWLPALAGSVRLAGRTDLADRLWPPRSRRDGIESRAAYYGGLFRTPDQMMGSGDDLRALTPGQTALAEAVALEWLDRITERAPAGSTDADQARRALDIARNPERAQAMGRGNVLREALKTLDRLPWIAKLGMALAGRLVTALTQVTRYLTDEMLREQARKAVLDFVDADTRVIIGHSLGSVVVYECAHLLTSPLPLLVTLGSPLGLRTIVTAHLSPPPSFPPLATVWLNVANREDVVAADPDLCPLFGRNVPLSSRFEGVRFDEACKNPHRAETYLGRRAVGRAVIKALA